MSIGGELSIGGALRGTAAPPRAGPGQAGPGQAVPPAAADAENADAAGGLRPPLTRRLRPAHWIAIDCLAAAAAAVFLVGGAERQPLFFGIPHWAAAAVAACVALPVAVRRLRPRAALAVILAATVAAGVAGVSTDPPVAAALVLYTIALRVPKPAAVRLLAAAVITVAAVIAAQMRLAAVTRHDSSWAGTMAARLMVTGLVLAAAWMIGYAVRQQRAYTAGLREQAERRAAEQVAEARRAITQERLRIARELHDIVAHNLSLIAVQAGVANYVVSTQPEQAARALSSIEQASRNALSEMRTLLGVLRADEPVGAGRAADTCLRPAPGLSGLNQLIQQTASAGVRVHLEVRGRQRQLPAGIDLAAYRVIQEALTNVIKHAAASSCKVLLAYGADTLTVGITDHGQGPRGAGEDSGQGAGHGIAGMRERVAIYGGRFHAGPLSGGGFRVTARLPLAPPPA